MLSLPSFLFQQLINQRNNNLTHPIFILNCQLVRYINYFFQHQSLFQQVSTKEQNVIILFCKVQSRRIHTAKLFKRPYDKLQSFRGILTGFVAQEFLMQPLESIYQKLMLKSVKNYLPEALIFNTHVPHTVCYYSHRLPSLIQKLEQNLQKTLSEKQICIT